MQNKSAIWVFAILLAAACIYQLSFTWVAGNVESEAKAQAEFKVDSVKNANPETSDSQLDSLKQVFEDEYLASQANQPVYPLFNFTFADVQKHELNKGLDLQGGMNVTLEVSIVDMIRVFSGNSQDPTFTAAIAKATEMQKSRQEGFVTLFGEAFNSIDPNAKLAAIFHTLENKEKIPRDASNEEVLAIIKEEANDAVKRTEQVIRKRIDNLGVIQPKVQRLESGRILVELPGVKNKERVRKILQGTARLEFWETYENSEIYPKLADLNDILKKEELLKKKSEETTANDSTEVAETTNDSSAATTSTLDQLLAENTDSTSTDSLSNPDDSNVNPLFNKLGPAINKNANGQYFMAKGPVVGYSYLKDTAEVNQFLRRKDARTMFPKTKFLWEAKPTENNSDIVRLVAIKVTNRDGKAPLEGDAVTDARVSSDAMGNPEVSLNMNSDGAKSWKLLTKQNIGKSVAIVLDDFVYSFPTVQAEISGGRSSISGQFTIEETEDLANVLKAGKLPAPSRIIEEAVVGPTLGESNINSGINSFLIAILIVLAYMIFYYNKAGLVSNVALIANVFFVLGVLASLGATLTLPGIAGIVLTIGMSVDANVLIYERIREELKEGKGIHLAISDGYKNAYSSIIDSNITTLLTGIILLIFGTGPIKGFATTLIIGICTSLFSAIFITRLLFEWLLEKNKTITFGNNFTENLLSNLTIGFVAKRKLFYVISGSIIVLGIASFAVKGLNYGVDFTGGRNYQVKFENPVDVNQIADILAGVFTDETGKPERPEVKTYGNTSQVLITTKYMIFETGDDVAERVAEKLEEGLNQVGSNYEIVSSQMVGPTIADDIKVSAIWSVLFSLIIIFLYIVFRFKKWQFGLGALVALFHDVIIVLSIFSIFYGILPFSLEIDQAFIAAILTVVGYSINDTVVVFDRIREYIDKYKRKDREVVINEALNNTIGRTLNTSFTTLIVLLMIFVFGGEVIRGFVFALIVGIVVGTYSSLCVATPIVVDLDKKSKE